MFHDFVRYSSCSFHGETTMAFRRILVVNCARAFIQLNVSTYHGKQTNSDFYHRISTLVTVYLIKLLPVVAVMIPVRITKLPRSFWVVSVARSVFGFCRAYHIIFWPKRRRFLFGKKSSHSTGSKRCLQCVPETNITLYGMIIRIVDFVGHSFSFHVLVQEKSSLAFHHYFLLIVSKTVTLVGVRYIIQAFPSNQLLFFYSSAI